jgi:hypothetical protein
MNMPVSISILTASMNAFEKDHAPCTPSAEGTARMKATTPYEWMRSWDTGMSSKTIWYQMMNQLSPDPRFPWDPDDFGRCYRLLDAFPAWRTRFEEMRTVKGWAKFVDAWPELERLYREELPQGDGPKLFALMKCCYPEGA